MITGVVTPYREAVIRLRVRGPAGNEEEVEAVIDTGFNRFLTLPSSLISLLGLPFEASTQATLADGRAVPMDYYRASVLWDGQDRAILVLAAEGGPLVGMSLLYGYDLRMRVVDGGLVTIEPLS
jgi:clan AA aspartic protease